MGSSGKEIHFRSEYASKTGHLVIGLMSGTSLDGVDAALVRIKAKPDAALDSVELIKHIYIPYSDELRALVAELCTLEGARLDDLVYAHYGLSEWYAEAVRQVIAEAGLTAENIDAISMHGQTIWHAPVPRDFPGPKGMLPVKGTLQLGSPSVLCERAGLPVVSDLRARDMAAGGEGAPLAPYIDALLFGDAHEGRIVQNIGGIGNATVIAAGASNQNGVTAFDTGPGNMIMDAVVIAGTSGKQRYDDAGTIAAKGRVDEATVKRLMQDPYFSRKPPKSTGREVYGKAFTEAFLKEAAEQGLSFEDRVATATAFTAESIARCYLDFILPTTKIAKVLVAGGGALNPTLLGMLGERHNKGHSGAPIQVLTTAALGVPDQAREAMAFALMAHESLLGRPGNIPAVTGAREAVVLGTLTL